LSFLSFLSEICVVVVVVLRLQGLGVSLNNFSYGPVVTEMAGTDDFVCYAV